MPTLTTFFGFPQIRINVCTYFQNLILSRRLVEVEGKLIHPEMVVFIEQLHALEAQKQYTYPSSIGCC